jgi:chemotaxis protein MotB
MAEKKAVIIKKVKKGGHGGHHGGAWKIAYADFVTAMMAFFLLMWLLNNVSEEKKEQLSIYFKEFSIIDGPPPSMNIGPGGQSSADPQLKPLFMEGTTGMFSEGKSQEEVLKEAMAKRIEDRLKEYKEELIVDTFDNGVRIQMLYDEGTPFFDSASAQLTGDARNVLRVIADTVRDLPNQLAVEGHTDAVPLGGPRSRYTNWELSTDRASSARVILEEFGLDPKRMVRVAGYAATQPLIIDNPEDPRNRRVSILLFNDPTRTPMDLNGTASESPLSINPLNNDTYTPTPSGPPSLPSR